MQVAITRLYVSAEESDAAEGVPTLHMFQALIDTGASSTCISSDVVSRVGLVPTGKTMMSGVTGQKPVDQYSFSLGFLLSPTAHPDGSLSGPIIVRSVQGLEFNKGVASFEWFGSVSTTAVTSTDVSKRTLIHSQSMERIRGCCAARR